MEEIRNQKIRKVQRVIDKENKHLAEHKRSKVSVAKRKVVKLLEELKLTAFMAIGVEERRLLPSIDRRQKEEATVLDGCYDPADFNDRLLLGLKGTMSQAELHFIRVRLPAC